MSFSSTPALLQVVALQARFILWQALENYKTATFEYPVGAQAIIADISAREPVRKHNLLIPKLALTACVGSYGNNALLETHSGPNREIHKI